MTLKELDTEQQLALVGLARMMIRLDGEFSGEERERLDVIVGELGEGVFEELLQSSAEKMQDEEAVKYHARKVSEQGARELIYGVLFDLAVPGSIVPAEAALLSWLEDAWELQMVKEPYR